MACSSAYSQIATHIVCKIFNPRRNCTAPSANSLTENASHCRLPIVFKVPSWRDRDPAPVEGEVTPPLATGLTLSTAAEELEVDILLVGDVANVGAPRVRVPGDSADDSEEVKMSSLASGCDDGETRGDIPSDEAVTCIKLKLSISGLVIECKQEN